MNRQIAKNGQTMNQHVVNQRGETGRGVETVDLILTVCDLTVE